MRAALVCSIACVALAITGCPSSVDEPGPETKDGPPNLLLITIDTLRADRLGSYGYELDTSPRLDALAHSGVRFADATVPVPKTWPATASLLTGNSPHTTGVRLAPRVPLPEKNVTLAELLQRGGYTTGAVVSNVNLSRHFRYDQGFDDFVESWAEAYAEETGGGTLQRTGANITKKYTDGARVTDQGLRVLDELRARDRPFFLWVHYLDPHGPYMPPEEYLALFEGRHESRVLTPKEVPAYQRVVPPGRKWGFSLDLADYEARYDGEVRRMDDQLARLLEGLDERGLRDSTLVAVTADHGESFGEHGLHLEHGNGPYQSTAHVPLILSWPGHLPAEHVVEAPVGLIDVAPTLLELLGQPVPEGLDGRSLSKLIDSSRPGTPPALVFLESGYTIPPQVSVRRGPWKLIWLRTPKDERRFGDAIQLYDLSKDPGERTNLAARNPELVADLQGEIETWLAGQRERVIDETQKVELRQLDEHTQRQLEALGYLEPVH